MKRLGDIVLPAGLQWSNQGDSAHVSHVVRTDLSGRAVVFGPKRQPRAVTLTAGDDYGWIPEHTVWALHELARSAGPHPLVWGDQTVPVVFAGDPAIELTRLVPDQPWFVGNIYLLSVGG